MSQPVPGQTAGPAASGDGRCRFSEALTDFAKTVDGERLALATILGFMGRRSIGGLLLFLALPMALPIPAPGISVAFGIPLILVSAQLLLGRPRVWLPACIARRSMRRCDFVALVERALPTLRRFEAIVRPRISWLAGDWTTLPIGAISLVLAVIITLPVPLGHMLPGAAISLLALGLMERDGLAIGLGLITAVVALAVVALASHGIAIRLHMYFG